MVDTAGIESASLFHVIGQQIGNPNVFKARRFAAGLKSGRNRGCGAYCAPDTCGIDKAARDDLR
jgi:hypothetical protein